MPIDSNSDGALDGPIDVGLLDNANGDVYNRSGGLIPDNLHTLQPRGSEDADDIYPYANPSPVINKPTIVGGLSQKRFISEYGTDGEIEKVAVANLSQSAMRNAQN